MIQAVTIWLVKCDGAGCDYTFIEPGEMDDEPYANIVKQIRDDGGSFSNGIAKCSSCRNGGEPQ